MDESLKMSKQANNSDKSLGKGQHRCLNFNVVTLFCGAGEDHGQ